MKTAKITNLGQYGILSDQPTQELPPNAFTGGQNVRVNDNAITNAPGHIQVLNPPSVAPYWGQPIQTTSTYFWLYAGSSKIYATDNGPTHTNITRQQTTSISTIGTGNPTTITTSAAHNITDGDTVTIAGVSGNTPNINTTHTATVTGPTTFTIPVNTTVAGTGGNVTNDVDYSMDSQQLWNGGVLSGVVIANNGIDEPQVWETPSLGTVVQNLSDASDWTADDTCMCIRPFRNFLIALDVTKSSTRYPFMVKWNHPSTPGTVDGSWDETDATKDAGENSLIEGGGFVVDGLTLRDQFIIYREDATWSMQFIGGNEIFSFKPLFKTSGILAPNCAVEYKNKHYVLTRGDVVAHDGYTLQSIIDKKNRRFLFNEIDTTNYKKSFLAVNQRKEEIWVCYPSNGSTYVDKALVYRVDNGSWAPRDLPDVSHIELGIIDETESSAWSADADNWNEDDSTWNQVLYNQAEVVMMMFGTNDTKLYKGNTTNTENGTTRTCYIEREGLQLGDYSRITHINAVYPKIEATPGTQISVSVGGEMNPGSGVSWQGPYTFTVGTDKRITCRSSGRLSAVKFQTSADVAWRLQSYEIEFSEGGKA